MRLPRRSTLAASARRSSEIPSPGPGSHASGPSAPASPAPGSHTPDSHAAGSQTLAAFASAGLVALALAAFALAALPESAEAQRRGTRSAATGRSVRSTSPHAVTTRALRASRGRSLSVRSVPTAPFGIRRLPVIGRDGRVFPGDAFLRPFTPREAPIVEVIPRDPFDERRFGDPFGHDRFDRDRRHRDPFGRDGFRHDRRFRGHHDACARGAGLRVRVGSHGVSVGVGTRGHRAGAPIHFRCVKDHRGAVILVPVGGVYYGGTAAGDTYGDPADAGDGYHAENATGTEFSGNDRGVPLATGCAAVTVRLRGGEWYGAQVRLPALDAETPEALAAALRTRHRHGRSTILDGFEGQKLAVPAGPGVEGVDVEHCL